MPILQGRPHRENPPSNFTQPVGKLRSELGSPNRIGVNPNTTFATTNFFYKRNRLLIFSDNNARYSNSPLTIAVSPNHSRIEKMISAITLTGSDFIHFLRIPESRYEDSKRQTFHSRSRKHVWKSLQGEEPKAKAYLERTGLN